MGEEYVTNESLQGICEGLDVNSGDNILAIGTDQAFALLEYANSVRHIDIDPYQSRIMYNRAFALENNDYEAFLGNNRLSSPQESLWGNANRECSERIIQARDNYFKTNNRLEKIKNNLTNLTILKPMDILDAIDNEDGINKVYTSNALFWDYHLGLKKTPQEVLRDIAQTLPKEGLIYVTDHETLVYRTKGFSFSDMFRVSDNTKEYDESILPDELLLDKQLTEKAARLEDVFSPAVYRVE